MDKSSRKRLKDQLRAQQRRAALRALPLSIAELVAMFAMLQSELREQGCDRTRRITRAWLVEHGHDIESVGAWLDQHNGCCDCDVHVNVRQHFDEARQGTLTPPD